MRASGAVTLTGPRLAALVIAGAVGLRHVIRRTVERHLVSTGLLLNLSLSSCALVVSLLLADLGVSAYVNLTMPSTEIESLARNDEHAMVGEWYPRLYFPTPKNFRVHKPGFSISGSHYGGLYLPAMLGSATLVNSVLDRRRVSIHINELGFRDSGAIGSCPVFALGDSFTFGWGVTEGATWPDLLERSLDTCVYNLGVNDASPKQELLLLEHLLARHGPLKFRRLLWVIYEGNDLEDSYADGNPVLPRQGMSRLTHGTILEAFPVFLDRLRTQSLIHRLRTGQLRLRPPPAGEQTRARYTIDGVRLATPLFHSARFGHMLLGAPLLDRSARPKGYTLGHRHRRQLDRTLRRMRHLSDSLDFTVTVVLVPTSARLYAPYFHPAPAPSAEPHFIRYVEQAARGHGFDVIDLLRELEPHARTDLLYFRDDDHLNPRGHEVVAEILGRHLKATGQGRREIEAADPGESPSLASGDGGAPAYEAAASRLLQVVPICAYIVYSANEAW
jgi:lysophospholipase L1-like esterase